MSSYSVQILTEKLARLSLSQDSIETLSLWIIHHKGKAKTSVSTWLEEFKKGDAERRLTLLYLANDVLQNGRRRGAGEFLDLFQDVLRMAVPLVRGQKVQDNFIRVLRIWKERKIYDSRFIGELELVIEPSRAKKVVEKPAELKLSLLEDALTELRKFEAELKVKSSHLAHLRVDINHPTASLEQLKDKADGGRVSMEINDAAGKLQDYCECLGVEVNERINILDMLRSTKAFSTYKLNEFKRTMQNYKDLGTRMDSLKDKLQLHLKDMERAQSTATSDPTAEDDITVVGDMEIESDGEGADQQLPLTTASQTVSVTASVVQTMAAPQAIVTQSAMLPAVSATLTSQQSVYSSSNFYPPTFTAPRLPPPTVYSSPQYPPSIVHAPRMPPPPPSRPPPSFVHPIRPPRPHPPLGPLAHSRASIPPPQPSPLTPPIVPPPRSVSLPSQSVSHPPAGLLAHSRISIPPPQPSPVAPPIVPPPRSVSLPSQSVSQPPAGPLAHSRASIPPPQPLAHSRASVPPPQPLAHSRASIPPPQPSPVAPPIMPPLRSEPLSSQLTSHPPMAMSAICVSARDSQPVITGAPVSYKKKNADEAEMAGRMPSLDNRLLNLKVPNQLFSQSKQEREDSPEFEDKMYSPDNDLYTNFTDDQSEHLSPSDSSPQVNMNNPILQALYSSPQSTRSQSTAHVKDEDRISLPSQNQNISATETAASTIVETEFVDCNNMSPPLEKVPIDPSQIKITPALTSLLDQLLPTLSKTLQQDRKRKPDEVDSPSSKVPKVDSDQLGPGSLSSKPRLAPPWNRDQPPSQYREEFAPRSRPRYPPPRPPRPDFYRPPPPQPRFGMRPHRPRGPPRFLGGRPPRQNHYPPDPYRMPRPPMRIHRPGPYRPDFHRRTSYH